ncbi:MAG: hypothetical protein Rubg2KO_22060 [Rubricoccaceae bacterium]
MFARLSLFAAVLLATSAMAAPIPPADHEDDPAIYAVVFSAEWCGKCKVLEPKLMPVMQSMMEDEDVQFVMLDFTDRETTAAAEYTASSLDLAEVYDDNKGKTGFVLLIRADSGEVLDTILSNDDTRSIRSKIQSAVASAS